MTNLSELREKAERAAGGEWFCDPKPTKAGLALVDNGTSSMYPIRAEWHEAAYIVAAQPQVVIGMIDELEAKDRRIQALEKALEDLEARCEHVAATRSRKAYLQMVEDGQSEALIALDASRRAARSTLTGEKK